MKEFLESLIDLLGGLFGDGGTRRTVPTRPLELPPAPIPPPVADPDEPQDSSDLGEDDNVVITHEAESIDSTETPEFEDNPAPPPLDPEDDPAEEDTGIPTSPSPSHPEHKARYVWCLDGGHGNKTAGKRSPPLADGERFMEYEFNRDIIRRITNQLDVIGIRYFVTVPEVNVGNFLEQRVNRANRLSTSLPKIFVSIHGNAGPARSINDWTGDDVRGIETWHYHRSAKGKKLAAVFHGHLIQQTGFKNRHLRSRVTRQFYVLRATKMPAVLTENGFYNNRFEVLEMMRDDVRQHIADAHVLAIRQLESEGL